MPLRRPRPRTSENISKRLRRRVSWARSSAPRWLAVGERFGFEDVEGGEAGAHGETVFAEGGGVDDGFFEGAVDGFVDVIAHEDGGDGDEASAEGFGEDDHVGLHVVVMGGDEGASASDAGLNFVEDEQGAVFFAEGLDGCEIAGGRGDDAGFALEGLEDDGGDFLLLQGGFDGGDIAEGDFIGLGEHGAETFFPEGVSH